MFYLKLFSYQKHSLTCVIHPQAYLHTDLHLHMFSREVNCRLLQGEGRFSCCWLCLRSKSDHEYIVFQDLLSIFNNTFDISHKITSDLGFLTYQEPRSKSLINVLLWLICSNLWWEFSALYISLDQLIWSFLTSKHAMNNHEYLK